MMVMRILYFVYMKTILATYFKVKYVVEDCFCFFFFNFIYLKNELKIYFDVESDRVDETRPGNVAADCVVQLQIASNIRTITV